MTLEQILLIAGFVVTIITQTVVTVRWVIGSLRIIETEARQERAKIRQDLTLEDAALHKRISDLREEFSNFKLEVAKHYASENRLTETENRLTNSIDKLVNRFDSFSVSFQESLNELLAALGKHRQSD